MSQSKKARLGVATVRLRLFSGRFSLRGFRHSSMGFPAPPWVSPSPTSWVQRRPLHGGLPCGSHLCESFPAVYVLALELCFLVLLLCCGCLLLVLPSLFVVSSGSVFQFLLLVVFQRCRCGLWCVILVSALLPMLFVVFVVVSLVMRSSMSTLLHVCRYFLLFVIFFFFSLSSFSIQGDDMMVGSPYAHHMHLRVRKLRVCVASPLSSSCMSHDMYQQGSSGRRQ